MVMIEEALSDKAFRKFKIRVKIFIYGIGLLVMAIAVSTLL